MFLLLYAKIETSLGILLRFVLSHNRDIRRHIAHRRKQRRIRTRLTNLKLTSNYEKYEHIQIPSTVHRCALMCTDVQRSLRHPVTTASKKLAALQWSNPAREVSSLPKGKRRSKQASFEFAVRPPPSSKARSSRFMIRKLWRARFPSPRKSFAIKNQWHMYSSGDRTTAPFSNLKYLWYWSPSYSNPEISAPFSVPADVANRSTQFFQFLKKSRKARSRLCRRRCLQVNISKGRGPLGNL